MKSGLLLLLIVCSAMVSFAQVDSLQSTESPIAATEAVRALETRRQAALVAADTKTLAEIFAPNATYVHANGLMQTRDELFSVLERGDIRYLSFVLEDVRYRAYGETVVGTGVQRLEVESAGKSMGLRSRYTVVYVGRGEAAKLVAYQSTSVPEMMPRR